jgi:tetratricopeptide (TPR) repeat protein
VQTVPDDRQRPQGDFIENPTDEDYAAAARAALGAKNHRLALEQAAAAASLRPLHEPHVRLLDEVIASTKAPLVALQLSPGGTFFGLVAARARALARLHRTGEALDCLFHATTFSPKTPFLRWALAWVAHARDAKRVDPKALALAIVLLASEKESAAVANLEAADAIAEKVQRATGDGEGVLVVARSRVMRALGRHDDALALLAGRDDWASVVERGALHRERGDLEERVRSFEQASELRPEDAATQLDLGDAYLADARLDDAARAYERALALEPSQPWGRAALAYMRFLTSGEPMPHEFAVDDATRGLVADAEAYVTTLPDPIDPVVRVLRSVARGPASTPDQAIRVRVRAERPLAPSASAAFDLVLARLGRKGTLDVALDGDLAPSRFGPAWRLEGGRWVPSVAQPSEETIASVAALAKTPFAWDAWLAAAGAAPTANNTIDGLLAAMAHVPAPPDDRDVVQHVHAFQVAAALHIALGPWPETARLAALTSLAEAVDDWTAAAAWLGLRALAGTAELRPQIAALARRMLPDAQAPLPPTSRALAVIGCELATDDERAPFLGLRARVRHELAGA